MGIRIRTRGKRVSNEDRRRRLHEKGGGNWRRILLLLLWLLLLWFEVDGHTGASPRLHLYMHFLLLVLD